VLLSPALAIEFLAQPITRPTQIPFHASRATAIESSHTPFYGPITKTACEHIRADGYPFIVFFTGRSHFLTAF